MYPAECRLNTVANEKGAGLHLGQVFFNDLRAKMATLTQISSVGMMMENQDYKVFLRIQAELPAILPDGTDPLLQRAREYASNPDLDRYLGTNPARHSTATYRHVRRYDDYSNEEYIQFFIKLRHLASEIAKIVAMREQKDVYKQQTSYLREQLSLAALKADDSIIALLLKNMHPLSDEYLSCIASGTGPKFDTTERIAAQRYYLTVLDCFFSLHESRLRARALESSRVIVLITPEEISFAVEVLLPTLCKLYQTGREALDSPLLNKQLNAIKKLSDYLKDPPEKEDGPDDRPFDPYLMAHKPSLEVF